MGFGGEIVQDGEFGLEATLRNRRAGRVVGPSRERRSVGRSAGICGVAHVVGVVLEGHPGVHEIGIGGDGGGLGDGDGGGGIGVGDAHGMGAGGRKGAVVEIEGGREGGGGVDLGAEDAVGEALARDHAIGKRESVTGGVAGGGIDHDKGVVGVGVAVDGAVGEVGRDPRGLIANVEASAEVREEASVEIERETATEGLRSEEWQAEVGESAVGEVEGLVGDGVGQNELIRCS